MARESNRWHFQQFCEPSPWLSDEEVEEAKRRNSLARYNRLWWGIWASGLGDAIDDGDIQACIDTSLGPMGKQPGWFYIAGIDLGITHDHSANRGRRSPRYAETAARLCRELGTGPKTRKVDLVRVESTVLEMNRRYGFSLAGYDPYACQLLAQRLERQGVKMKEVAFTGKNLNEMASTLLEVFRASHE